MNDFVNLLTLNGMNYPRDMTKFALHCTHIFACINFLLPIDAKTELGMLKEVEEHIGSDYARVESFYGR